MRYNGVRNATDASHHPRDWFLSEGVDEKSSLRASCVARRPFQPSSPYRPTSECTSPVAALGTSVPREAGLGSFHRLRGPAAEPGASVNRIDAERDGGGGPPAP